MRSYLTFVTDILSGHTPGDTATLNLKPCKGRLANRGMFEGSVRTAAGKEVYKLSGSCMDKVSVGGKATKHHEEHHLYPPSLLRFRFTLS